MRFGPLLFAACLTPALAWAADADLILHHGKIVTADAKFSLAEAVAVRGGRITAVGTDQAVLAAERGASTRLIDLQGRTVLPGLIDSHVHALSAGLSEFRGALPPLDSFAAVQDYIREQAKRTAKGRWIVVPRTFPTRLKEMRMPTREVLDVAPDHPVLFDASYVVVVNTAALRLRGITRATPNPPGGEIVHDAAGEPNGILRNAQSLLKRREAGPEFTEAEKLQALEQMLKAYTAAGLTSVGDRAVTGQEIGLYRKLKAAGRLPVRAVLTWRPADPAEARNVDFKTNDGDEWLKFGAYKITLDGGMTIGSAYQRYPYGAFGKQLYGLTDPDDRGQLFVGPEKLLQLMSAARDKGWQLTTHCQGGGAIDAFLDTLEALDRQHAIRPTRSHLMHASFQSPEALDRAKRLGVLADVQSPWLYRDGEALERVFGSDGMRYFFPLRAYIDRSIIIAGGSDHMIGFDRDRAVNPYNPFLSMCVAVTRKTDRGRAIHPEQRISREEALRMHTTWAAYLQFGEKEKGSIEMGKLADLVVLDRDYLTCGEDEIARIRPVMTMIDGKVVFSQQPGSF